MGTVRGIVPSPIFLPFAHSVSCPPVLGLFLVGRELHTHGDVTRRKLFGRGLL